MNAEDTHRPRPDIVLAHISHEEEKKNRGRLKVFLGMAAGVGKTYTMLKEGSTLGNAGVDVIIGVVETHGRKETLALTDGLEMLPRKKIVYHEIHLEEFDVEEALKRKPNLVLVDELAHTNAPNSKHNKRYLDVIDLINAGIDVYTTMNIQHLESRSDTVKEITGITIHETVPDSFFDLADEIIIIDLSPEELLKRLNEGKIYPRDRITTAEQNFFKKGNLTALREMALRHATERVDRDLRDFKQLHGIENAWKSSNRLLVAIFASPYSETLIRWTRRLADMMGATWLGAYVEQTEPLSDEERILVAKNMTLVKELGGEVITTKENDIVDGLIRIARQNNVTQIIIGKSLRGFISNIITGGSIVSRLLRRSGDIDVYCVNPNQDQKKYLRSRKNKSTIQEFFQFEDLGWLTITLLISWPIAAVLEPVIGYHAVGIIFLVFVCLAGLVLSRSFVFILATIFSLIHNFYFIPPLHSFNISKPEDYILLTTFFVAAAIIGHLTARLKLKEKILIERENISLRQYELSHMLAKTQSVEEVAAIGLQQIQKVMKQDVCLFLADAHLTKLSLFQRSGFGFTPKEKAVAEWVWKNSTPAGKFTDTLSASEGFYLPIIGKNHSIGVIGIKVAKKGELTIDEQSFIGSVANQLAAALERESFHEQSRSLKVMDETQKLYKTLLDSVSHELKTPLAAIKGSASALLDPAIKGNPQVSDTLSTEILVGASRLQRLVENLLDMTRVDSGMLKPKLAPYSPAELIDACLRKEVFCKLNRTIEVKIEPQIPDIICDPTLTEQALNNIIHNAITYTTGDIQISAKDHGEKIAIIVRDYGKGLPKNEPLKVFDKFFRADPQFTGGVGIGLSIAKNFIELQKGELIAQNHPDGGAQFIILLSKFQGGKDET